MKACRSLGAVCNMKRSLIVVGLIGTFLFVATSAQADSSQTNWSDTVSGLRLRIWTDKETYQTNEAILLNLQLNNVSSQELAVVISSRTFDYNKNAPLYDIERVIISTTNNKTSPITLDLYPVWSQMFVIQGMTNLPPSGTVQETSRITSAFWHAKVSGNNHPVSFQLQPGSYSIQAIYAFEAPPPFVKREAEEFAKKGVTCWTGRLPSNIVKILVKENE